MSLDAAGRPLHTRALSVALTDEGAPRVGLAAYVLDLRKRGFAPVAADLQGTGIIHHMQLDGMIDRDAARWRRGRRRHRRIGPRRGGGATPTVRSGVAASSISPPSAERVASAATSSPSAAPAPPDLQDRLMLPLINEAVAVLREHIVADADLIDAGVIFGAGFAPFRGGPLRYARERGLKDVHARLLELEAVHGARFHPDDGWFTVLREPV